MNAFILYLRRPRVHLFFFLTKGVCVCVRLTYYIELSHAVFDAAAVARYTCVSASIVRGDTCDQQGAVGHLLEPGRKNGISRPSS